MSGDVRPRRGLLIGRFQPFHRGHLAVIQWARAQHPEEWLILGIGSAQESHTTANPFTAGERWEMIAAGLSEAHVDRWVAFPIPDIQRHAQWVAYVRTLLPAFDRIYTNNPLTRMLFDEAHIPVEAPPMEQRETWQGASIRQRMAKRQSWEAAVPPAVLAYLQSIRAPERLRLLTPDPRAG
ncbi:MAG TPA: nicotinamide-nucleotide adenylyltransferase, partial [Thermoplasmata archaeon]|nr:nicotinamide-nucleotide adenylyltransferase [Thermoplasmata archaeon]